MTKPKCPYCDHAVHAGAEFCPDCGADLTDGRDEKKS
jgi:RNA polymerase subunit RPABC4/transcription elongation factor Spt4